MLKLGIGKDAPRVVNVLIEIRRGEGQNKYEIDKESGMLILDRVNATKLGYPADYGYVPETLCGDGDPLDALVVIDESIPQGVVVPVRPIGALRMVDDGEADEKLICVAVKDITKDHIHEVDDLGPNFKQTVEHFYSHYKDWKNNWKGVTVQFNGWANAAESVKLVEESTQRYKEGRNG